MTFDGLLTFDHAWNHRTRIWGTDDYQTSVFGLGFGVNGAIPVTQAMLFDWRVGYAGTWTVRHASTDSLGIASTQAVSTMHRASAMGKLTYALPDGMSSIFADATLNAILADNTAAARAANPFDLDLGAGGSFSLGTANFDLGLNVGGIGRPGETSYGASALVTFPF